MDANTGMLLKDKVYRIVGCAFDALNFKRAKLEWERLVLDSAR